MKVWVNNMADVQSYIDNTEQLMNDLGDKKQKGTQVNTLLADYKKTATVWNRFLNSQIKSCGGDPSTLKSEQEKIDYIREHTFYGGQDKFLTELQGQVESRDSRRDELKNLAEEILKKQQDLIEKNNKIIEELNEALKNDFEKKALLEKEIAEKANEINSVKAKLTKRETLLTTLQTELNNLQAAPKPDKKLIADKSKEIQDLRGEISGLSDNFNELEAAKNNKTNELTSLIGTDGKDLDNRQAKINDLSSKNNDLKEHLDKNYKEIDEVFSKDGIKIQNPSITVEQDAPQTPSSPGDEEALVNSDSNRSEGTVGSGNGGVAQPSSTQPQNLPVRLSDKQIAMNMAREFRQAKTTEERIKMINGYGYTDLVAMLDRVGPIERRRITKALREERDYLKVPDEAELMANIQEITQSGELASSAFGILFRDGKPRYFKNLSEDELRQIREIMEVANKNREEIGRNNPEALKYFDANFANFVKTGSLYERARTGWIKNFFADMVDRKGKTARDNLAGTMRDYTMHVQDENTDKVAYENNIRRILGQEVKPVSDPRYTDRGNSRHESIQQEVDHRSVTHNSGNPER